MNIMILVNPSPPAVLFSGPAGRPLTPAALAGFGDTVPNGREYCFDLGTGALAGSVHSAAPEAGVESSRPYAAGETQGNVGGSGGGFFFTILGVYFTILEPVFFFFLNFWVIFYIF
jgi:hypothetical protein